MLVIENVSKSFPRTSAKDAPQAKHRERDRVTSTSERRVQILRNIELTINDGEIACLLGPSGCGKTTLLRIVAGLEEADSGQIFCEGENMASLPVHQRHFGFMFQDFALFPHKTVGQNIAFGLRMSGWARPDIEARVVEMLELVDLAGYEKRSPLSLSGGEQQRVALARSLAPNPRLLMLDEPLGSLDRALRESLMTELRLILKEVGVTALYVTHDQEEAYAVADTLVVMNRGNIMQSGAPIELYRRPANRFVARFLGFSNLLEGTVHSSDPAHVETPLGRWPLGKPAPAGRYTCLIRPTGARLLEQSSTTVSNQNAENNQNTERGRAVTGMLVDISFRGSACNISIQVDTQDDSAETLQFELPTEHFHRNELDNDIQIGQAISLLVDASQIVLLAD